MRVAAESSTSWRYDEARQLSVDSDGRPVVLGGMFGETATESRADPADPAQPGASRLFETMTKVAREAPDDAMAWAETETRTKPDPADPAADGWVEFSADDSLTGVVAF